MLTHAELKVRVLSIPEVKARYDSLAEEYALARELLQASEAAGLTQAVKLGS